MGNKRVEYNWYTTKKVPWSKWNRSSCVSFDYVLCAVYTLRVCLWEYLYEYGCVVLRYEYNVQFLWNINFWQSYFMWLPLQPYNEVDVFNFWCAQLIFFSFQGVFLYFPSNTQKFKSIREKNYWQRNLFGLALKKNNKFVLILAETRGTILLNQNCIHRLEKINSSIATRG